MRLKRSKTQRQLAGEMKVLSILPTDLKANVGMVFRRMTSLVEKLTLF